MTDIAFSARAFQAALETEAIGRFLVYRPVTESTMIVARREADEGAPTGTLVLAESQTAGRGRKGRAFHSDEAGGLYFTIILRLAAETAARLPLVAPLAVARACLGEGADARVKWPNDVWIGERKLSGMLIDTQFETGMPLALVGIGINVNTDPAALPELRDIATSLRSELGRNVAREPLLARICNAFEGLLAAAPHDLTSAYRERSMVLGREVDVTRPDGAVARGMAIDIGHDGALIVRYADRREEALSAAEVTLRPAG